MDLEHPAVAQGLNNRPGVIEEIVSPLLVDPFLTELHATFSTTACQGKYAEAEPLYERSHAILSKTLGPGHPHVAATLNNWAAFFAA